MQDLSKPEVVKARVTKYHLEKLIKICDTKGITISQWIRDRIERARTK